LSIIYISLTFYEKLLQAHSVRAILAIVGVWLAWSQALDSRCCVQPRFYARLPRLVNRGAHRSKLFFFWITSASKVISLISTYVKNYVQVIHSFSLVVLLQIANAFDPCLPGNNTFAADNLTFANQTFETHFEEAS
jgi:hypothetical protein